MFSRSVRRDRSARSVSALASRAQLERLEPRQLMSRVSGYLPDYRVAAGILSKFDWDVVTHVDYFSIKPEQFMPDMNNHYTAPTTTTNNLDLSYMAQAVNAAHGQVKPKTISLVIGGAGYSTGFANVFDTQAHINTFIGNVVSFVTSHNMDGVDLDWEPNWGTLTTSQITRYSNLITSFKAQYPALSLTSAVAPTPQPTNPGNTAQAYVLDHAAINALDYVNVMAYDFEDTNNSSFNDSINALQAFATYADPNGSMDARFILGLPFYGDSTSGQLEYFNIVSQYHPLPGADSAGPWTFNGQTTIANKTKYVVDHHYGGVMIWDVGEDDFNGNAYSSYALTPSIKSNIDITGATFASLTAGKLTLMGTDGADQFTMSVSGSNLSVKLGTVTQSYALSAITSVVVDGQGADDTFDFNGPVSKPVSFYGGSGFDTLNVNSGTFTLGADAFPGNFALVVNVAAGATIALNSAQHLDGLNLLGAATVATGGANTLYTRGLTIGAAGSLDLKNNRLIYDYSGASPIGTRTGTTYSGVTGMIQSGRNGGAWNGHGIVTTSASGSLTTLGAAEASQALGISGTQTALFGGQTVDATAVLVKYTYGGDANLDGKINVDDYTRIDFNVPLGSGAWYNGDFNYDGKINVDDYTIIDFNVPIQGSPLSGASGSGSASATSLVTDRLPYDSSAATTPHRRAIDLLAPVSDTF